MILPDILHHNLDIVFCGTAAGDISALRNAYYAGPGNQFYSTLAAYGFTSRLLMPEEFTELPIHKIGLTDLAKQTHGMDSKIKRKDFDIEGFEQKILNYQPKFVCFNGKKAASIYLRLPSTTQVFYGLQNRTIGKSKLYVAPSTSGAGRGAWDISLWHDLKKYI
jgi:double-stranded uracil-DNA glycosylase